MPAESRQHPRAQLAGIDVRYPDVNGHEVVARARDIGRGGLFVETPHLVPIGETRELELRIAGEEAPITATARVAWARTRQDDPQRPIGMAFAFLEVDAAAVDRIGALVAGRERTISGLGHGVDAPPAAQPPAPAPAVVLPTDTRDTSIGLPRELTLGGVGGRTSHPLREQTLIGVGEDTAPALEPEKSIPIGLVAKKALTSPAKGDGAVAIPGTRAVSLVEDEAPRRGGAGMVVALALLGILAGAGYVFRDRLAALVEPPPAPPPAAPAGQASASSATPPPPAPAPASSPAFGSAEADAASPADASISDASVADASAHDGGARGGAHHAAASGSAKKAAPAHAPKPKPTPSAEPENPY